MKKNFRPCLYLSFFHLKPNFRYSNLSFVRLSWGETTDKLAISLQTFAQVGLQLKFAFRIRSLVILIVTIAITYAYFRHPVLHIRFHDHYDHDCDHECVREK